MATKRTAKKGEIEMTWELKIKKEMVQYLVESSFDVTYNPFNLTDLSIKRYVFHFPNNWGASVIKGFGTYGYENDLWELAILKYYSEDDNWSLDYNNDVTDDVVGSLTDEQVNSFLEKIYQFK